jgi:MtN3 and saliva related transmembrane protein
VVPSATLAHTPRGLGHVALTGVSAAPSCNLIAHPSFFEARLRGLGMFMETTIGVLAAICTTVSYAPQIRKCWKTGQADDLSLRMFLLLADGIALWVVYGFLRGDIVIVIANSISLCLLTVILYFKARPRRDAAA